MSMTTGSSSSGVESILRLWIEQYLTGMEVTSSGGDSPKTNKVTFLPEVTGFGDIIDGAIRNAVIEHFEEQADNRNNGDILPNEEGGLGEGQAVGLGRSALSKFQNPQSLVSEGLQFLPHTAVVAFAVMLLPTIIEELTRPGGAFDLRFKRRVEEEYNSLEERKYLYDVNIGQKGLRFQSANGFFLHSTTGATSVNTQRLIRDGGIEKRFQTEINYLDYAEGLF